jgi:transposase-like protein
LGGSDQHTLCAVAEYVEPESSADLRALADRKKVYTAPNEEAASFALEEQRERWGSQYTQRLKVWDENRGDVSAFF